MENKNLYLNFTGEKFYISRELKDLVDFLQSIEQECEILLGYENRLESIRKQISRLLHLSISKESVTFYETLKIIRPIRSEMIVLFAYLETLIRLNFAYENKIHDGEKIRILTLKKSVWQSFYNNFCLSSDNFWVKKNLERAKYITAQDLRYLRNALTHFFSVDKGLGLSHAILDEKSRKLEKQTNYKLKFISPEDLFEIIKGAAFLMIKKWIDDCNENLKNNSEDFNERITAVINLIEESASKIMKNEEIKI